MKFMFFSTATVLLIAGAVFSAVQWFGMYELAAVPVWFAVPMVAVYVALIVYMAWMWLVVTAPKRRLIAELRRQCHQALASVAEPVIPANHTGVSMALRKSGKSAYFLELKHAQSGRAAWLIDPHRIERAEMDDMTPLFLTRAQVADAIEMLRAFNCANLNSAFIEAENMKVQSRLNSIRSMPVPSDMEFSA